MSELLKEIPTIMMYFVPGYLAVIIFERITLLSNGKKTESIEWIPCIVISFISTSLTQYIYQDVVDNKTIIAIISAILAAAVSMLLSFLMKYEWFNKIFIKITGTTVHNSIWYDILRTDKSSDIRYYGEFNHRKASISGTVLFYEVVKSGGCYIALKDYVVKYNEESDLKGRQYRPNSVDKPDNKTIPIICVYTSDVSNIEIFNYEPEPEKKKFCIFGSKHKQKQ